MYDLLSLVGGASSDILTAAQSPVAGVVGAAFQETLQRVMRGRAERARDILLEEVQAGQRALSRHEPDEVVSILYRYLRAAQEGAAAINLRIMARVVAGQAIHRAMYADDFLRDAALLSQLSSDEVALLGVIYRATEGPEPVDPDKGREVIFVGSLVVPALFPSGQVFTDACSCLLRTGYFRAHPTFGGNFNYTTTASYERLARLVRFSSWDPTVDHAAGRRMGPE